MAQRTSQGVMDRGSALPSGTAQPALPLAEALARCNPDQRAPSPALAKEDVLYATRPKPPAQLIRATRSLRVISTRPHSVLTTTTRRPSGLLMQIFGPLSRISWRAGRRSLARSGMHCA